MLIVVSQPCELQRAAKSITGIEVAEVRKINAELLAPGAIPGRMTIFTEGAIELLEKEKLFTGEKTEKKEEKKKSAAPKTKSVAKK
jgi:hypothetical protein